jgi:hypothetical protein
MAISAYGGDRPRISSLYRAFSRTRRFVKIQGVVQIDQERIDESHSNATDNQNPPTRARTRARRGCQPKSAPRPPDYPQVELPQSEIKSGGDKKVFELVRALFGLEPSQGWKLKQAADQLQNELAKQQRRAEEARDLVDMACTRFG